MDGLPILGIARPLQKKGAGATTKKSGESGKSASSKGPLAPELKQKVFKRDDNTCTFCRFKSQKYQEVHFLNNDIKDTNSHNLATACIFCHQCFNMEQVSIMRSGVLIWLPEISQAQLHHIARAIYVARISQGPVADAARRSLDTLMERREEVRKRIGTDDPYILAMVMRDYLGAKHYHYRDKKLEGVRLFPLDRRIIKEADLEFNQFPQILAYWRSKDGPFGGKAPPTWLSIYQDMAKAS
ncbi:MAG: hypothetical protein DHS20C02_20570 [Micavibrio sp.]|nr:MAG: hypothetical protein DHS20C02_20570 [Micavibrio sp.]